MLAALTSKQVADWIAFATMEQIGDDVPPDPKVVAEKKKEQARAKVTGGFRSLIEKQQQRG